MRDIVERLRSVAEFGGTHLDGIWTEAADEITRLREENKELAEALEYQARAWENVLELDLIQKTQRGNAEIIMGQARTVLSKHEGELKSVKYGCHLEIDPDQEPDECVMDIGDNCGCAFAVALSREGKDKTHCEFWKPIKGEQK